MRHYNQQFTQTKKIVGQLICLTVVFVLAWCWTSLPSLAQSKEPLFPLGDSPVEQSVKPPPVSPSPTALGLADPQEFATFVDNFFDQQLSESNIPGATISVVKDGKLFFAKGYGYANVEKKLPVDADKTLFRVASLSKLFTSTAAMQLYEQGRLDLDADVNQYLTTFKLDNPFSEPARVAQLMTHTDGTTKRRIGIAAPTAAGMQPLEPYLASHMPPIVREPGKLYSYSSHSIALLGYLVEQISGTPFAQYIDQNILQPLEMRRSTFLQPPPPALANDLAVGYQFQNGQFKPVPFLYLNIAPAASMSATATDMANFMIAHLLGGRYKNSRILQKDTVKLMHEQHFVHHPRLPGTGYSFRERLENNIRMVGHLGSLRGYSSSLTLLPDRNIGIFIATNSFSGIHNTLLSQILDRYFPVANKTPSIQPLPLDQSALDRFTGTYRDLEYPRDTLAIVSAPFKHINIEKGNGTLMLRRPNLFFLNNFPEVQLVPIEPLLFQHQNEDTLTAFGENERGQIAFAFNPIWAKLGAYERVPWLETVWVQLSIIGACAIAFLSAIVVYPIVPLIRWFRKKQFRMRGLNRAWQLAGWVGGLNLAFLVGLPLSLWLTGVWKLAYGVPTIIVALLCLPLITSVLTIGLAICTALAWHRQSWELRDRIHYSVITIAAIVFVPVLAYWNLLGFQY